MKKLFVILAAVITIGMTACVDENLTEIEQNVPEFKASNDGSEPESFPPKP